MNMELAKRYTYAVTQSLPEPQRADIEKELDGLIEDMLEDRLQGREGTQKDLEAVLLELGDPRRLADKYRGHARYLIGPEIFPIYMTILKLVLASTSLAMLVVFAVRTILDPTQILDYFVNGLLSFMMGIFQAFGWVTIIFGVVEYTGVQKEKLKGFDPNEWSLDELPELPDNENRIPRAEPIAGIVFTVLFAVLVVFSIHLLGIWIFHKGGPATVVPFFNEPVFRGFLPFILALLALGIGNEAFKLITGKWTVRVIAMDFLVNLLNMVLGFFMFANPAIWNPNFVQQLAQSGMIMPGSEAFQTVSAVWERVTGLFIYFVAVVFIIQLVTMTIKAFRMRSTAWRGNVLVS